MYLLFSKYEAIRMQFVTAIAAFLGTAFGLLAMNNETLETLLLSITSGGFIYVATVSVLPEVVHTKSSGRQSIAEVVCFLLGVGLMVLVAILE
jgi:solute carrier family 39 (zinc transporter), member 7